MAHHSSVMADKSMGFIVKIISYWQGVERFLLNLMVLLKSPTSQQLKLEDRLELVSYIVVH